MNRQVLAQAGALVAQVMLARREKAAISQELAYASIRREYRAAVISAVRGYLTGGGRVTRWRNEMGQAVIESFTNAFERGYADGGGDEIDAADDRWLTERQNGELANVAALFDTLRDGRADITNVGDEARARGDGYAATLDSVYSQGKLLGSANRTLVFVGHDGKENCATCRNLKGKRRTIKWILANDMIPYPGNAAFECGGWECQHGWADPRTGERVTL